MGYGIKLSIPRPPQWRHRSPRYCFLLARTEGPQRAKALDRAVKGEKGFQCLLFLNQIGEADWTYLRDSFWIHFGGQTRTQSLLMWEDAISLLYILIFVLILLILSFFVFVIIYAVIVIAYIVINLPIPDVDVYTGERRYKILLCKVCFLILLGKTNSVTRDTVWYEIFAFLIFAIFPAIRKNKFPKKD